MHRLKCVPNIFKRILDLGSGSRIPVRQKVRDACHGGTIWWNDHSYCCVVKVSGPQGPEATSNKQQAATFCRATILIIDKSNKQQASSCDNVDK